MHSRPLLLTLGLAVFCMQALGATDADARGRVAKSKHGKKQRKAGRGFVGGDYTSPGYRYGTMAKQECLDELSLRGVRFHEVAASGVAMPIRFDGPLQGVTFRGNDQTGDSSARYETLDCRLALALDDFAAQLAVQGVTTVIHYSMHRPPRRELPASYVGRQHVGAMAIDVAQFEFSDGSKLNVLDDFSGRIGGKTCGERATFRKRTPQAQKLRTILCDVVAANLFHVVLTPNHNRPHRNHFHMEVMTDTTWFLVD